MANLYRLLSGKIHRLNDAGVMEKHIAPYDFIPTEAELEANKWRMKLIGDAPESVKADNITTFTKKDSRWNSTPPELIPANIPRDSQGNPIDSRLLNPADNICMIGSVAAIKYIFTVDSVELLNTLETQELANILKTPRTSVLKAIKQRRNVLVFRAEQEAGNVEQIDMVPE